MASIRKKSPLSPAPGTGQSVSHVSPNIDDLLFYEYVDSRLAHYSEPVYGTPYRGKRGEFPHHKLVHVGADQGNGWVKHTYAADREYQGAYNLEYSNPSGSSSGFPSYTRKYIIPREELAEWVSSPDGDIVDSDSDKSASGNHLSPGGDDPDLHFNPEFDGFVFTSEEVSNKLPEELSSLYVMIIRKFEMLCDRRSFILNPLTGKLDPVLTRIVLKADAKVSDMDPSTGEYTVLDDLNCEWAKEVTKVDPEAASQGDELVSSEYLNYLCKHITLTNKIVPAGTPPRGPNADGVYTVITPINSFFSRETEKVDKASAMIDQPLYGQKYSSSLGRSVPFVKTIVDSSSTFDPLDDVTPISTCLSEKVSSDKKPFDDATYETYANFTLPPVLESIEIDNWSRSAYELRSAADNPWSIKNYDVSFPRIVYKREGYSGPCRATVERTWSEIPPTSTITASTIPQGLPIIISTPMVKINVPSCLHASGSLQLKQEGPSNWNSQIITADYPATDVTDWPDEIYLGTTVTPSGGGYLVQNTTIYPPK